LLIIIGFVLSLISTSLIIVDKFTEEATPTKNVKPPQKQKEKKD
jgi:hypothetical protein